LGKPEEPSSKTKITIELVILSGRKDLPAPLWGNLKNRALKQKSPLNW
jgi:hypothetical protein